MSYPPKHWQAYISKSYFPKELWPKDRYDDVFEFFDRVDAPKNASRTDVAKKVWEEHGERLLVLMGPKKTKLPRKVCIHVNDPKAGVSGVVGRLSPILI